MQCSSGTCQGKNNFKALYICDNILILFSSPSPKCANVRMAECVKSLKLARLSVDVMTTSLELTVMFAEKQRALVDLLLLQLSLFRSSSSSLSSSLPWHSMSTIKGNVESKYFLSFSLMKASQEN